MNYTRKALATRKRIIEAASGMMLNKGFTRTKLDEVLHQSRVRKGNFYYYFGSKDELGLAVIRETAGPIVATWVQSLVDPEADPTENIRKLAEQIASSELLSSGMGNPVTNLSCEMVEISDDFRDAISRIMQGVVEVFEGQFRRLKDMGRLPASYTPRELANYIVSLIEGGVLIFRMNRDSAQLTRTLEMGLMWVLAAVSKEGVA